MFKLKKNKDKKGFITEFKEFIMRGNVFDMAIGLIIATSFGKITASLVNDLFMPFIGWLIGDLSVTEFVVNLPAKAGGEAVALNIGAFISVIIDFLLVAFIIFLMIKVFAKTKELSEKLRRKEAEEEAAAEPEVKAPTTEELLTEILAEIKKK